MALYHFHVTQIKRSEGRTAVASAAYRAGEKLHNLWDGETHDYTKKGVLHLISYGTANFRILRTDHQGPRYEESYHQHRPSASATQQYGISY